jgi:alkylhydroperoxidase/carboxymuconolactone decarboxylase family protein YurZ
MTDTADEVYLGTGDAAVLSSEPALARAFQALAAAAADTGAAEARLSERLRELVFIAVNASTTTLYEPGIREHMRRAIAVGVPVEQIVEVLELVSVIGIHSCAIGVPILLEELPGGRQLLAGELPAELARIKDDFVRDRGYWSPLWDGLLRLAPDFFQAYLQFSSVPWLSGTMSPKERELIYIAVNASTTHLYLPGLRQHMRNAIGYGATRDEIVSVLRLTTLIGVHSAIVGITSLDALIGEG